MDVAAWLRELGLPQYTRAFAEHDVDAAALRLLTEGDLATLGVESTEHRRKLAAAISELRQVPASVAGTHEAQQAAERRQLTVLYCQMTATAEDDPESKRETVRRFHGRCTETAKKYGGYAANFYGDCMLVYFGWPQAHEDDAERAVIAGLALVRPTGEEGAPAARAGIGTGLVVVGDLIREGPARHQSAVGLTPNLAARLLGLGSAGQVVVDDATQQLVQHRFSTRALGSHTLKGISSPVSAHAVVGERLAPSRFEARSGSAVMPMVGRDQELALLNERWAQAQDGEGTVVLLVGEAGIGKSRLTRALLDACTAPVHRVRWQCSPFHAGSALWPVIQRVRLAAELQSEDSNETALDKLEATVPDRDASALYAVLLGLEGAERYGPLEMTPQMLRERTLQMLLRQLFAWAEQKPLLLIVEDAHWIDPTTLELIERCLDEVERSRVLILITSRPDNPPALAAHPCVMRLSLSRLSRSGVEAIAERLAGGSLKPQTLARIVAQSDGMPLFAEELTKAVVETGEAAIPASLHGSLMARLDRIPEAKEIAQIAATIGREFDEELVQAVAGQSSFVPTALDRLVETGLVFRRGRTPVARYAFKHALVQQAVHESLLSGRREALHARILDALEQCRPDTPREVLAHHAAAANALGRAALLWRDAGKTAQAQGALAEACAFLENAIESIRKQPVSSEHRMLELELQSRLGLCRTAIPEAAGDLAREAFERANELSKLVSADPGSRLWAQFGLWNWYHTHGELTKALHLALEALTTAEAEESADATYTAERMVATTHLYLGDLAKAQEWHERALALADSDGRPLTSITRVQHVGTLYQYGFLRCLQGHFDHSRRLMQDALEQCTALTPVHQRRYLHLLAAIAAALARDPAQVRAELSAASELTLRHGMSSWLEGYGNILNAWIALESGHVTDDEVARLAYGIERLEASGTLALLPLYLTWLATALSLRGRLDEARQTIDRASTLCDETHQGWCEAEVWRVRGELHLQAAPPDLSQATRCFSQALALARSQGAKLWELRVAADLTRLAMSTTRAARS